MEQQLDPLFGDTRVDDVLDAVAADALNGVTTYSISRASIWSWFMMVLLDNRRQESAPQQPEVLDVETEDQLHNEMCQICRVLAELVEFSNDLPDAVASYLSDLRDLHTGAEGLYMSSNQPHGGQRALRDQTDEVEFQISNTRFTG